MVSAGSQSQESQSGTTFSTSPFGASFMNLFEGSEFRVDPVSGAIMPVSLPNIDPIFSFNDFQSIRDLLTPNRPFEQDLGALGGEAQNLFGILKEGAETGFAPRLMDLERNILFGSTIPQLKEEFGTKLGLNVGDSDFNAALARAVESSAYKAAAGAVENMGLFTQAGLAEIPGLASLEQLLSDAAVARTPGGTAINLFNTLASIGTQQPFLGGSWSTSEGSGTQFGFMA